MYRLPMPSKRVAVLCSGGIDSSILAAEYARQGATVYPLYIRCGLRWEVDEGRAVQEFCAACRLENLHAPTFLDLPVADVYGSHWSTDGARPVPAEGTAASAVYLPGRNLLLLSKAATWCALHDVHTLATAPLSGNPFADATPEFYRSMERSVREGLRWSLFIVTPFIGLHKADVIRLGKDLPLHLTLSCIAPTDGLHCGCCNKCEERRIAFRDAGVPDATMYTRRCGT